MLVGLGVLVGTGVAVGGLGVLVAWGSLLEVLACWWVWRPA